jgi:hypothetical protein
MVTQSPGDTDCRSPICDNPGRPSVGRLQPGEGRQLLRQEQQEGRGLTFGSPDADVAIDPADSWDTIAGKCPAGWTPDAVVVRLASHAIAEGLCARGS